MHHGILRLDRSPTSRQAAEVDNGDSFEGMEMPRTEAPGGQFIGWTPGGDETPVDVQAYPQGRSAFGVYNLAGDMGGMGK